MRKKTLIFYINAIHEGGAERVILQLAYRFYLAGYNSILVTSFIDENEYQIPEGVKRISIEQNQIIQSKFKRNLSRIITLRKICKKYEPEAIISFMGEPNFRTMIATIGLPLKKIVSVRNDPSKEYAGILGVLVGKILLPFANGCVFQTEDAMEWFPKDFKKSQRLFLTRFQNNFLRLSM